MAAESFYPPGRSGGGGGGGSTLAGAVVNIGSGQSSISVAYSSPLAEAGVPLFSFINTVDPMPIFLQGIVTALTVNGFTILFNAPTDTANYRLAYAIMETT